jgi:hypothetical protein
LSMGEGELEAENIQLWILDQERNKDRARAFKEATRKTQVNSIKNSTCKSCRKTFNEPKLVQYYACPHCSVKLEEEESPSGCPYWFGFLSQKNKSESIPSECVGCDKVMDCMLNRYYDSLEAVAEIKKWY